MNVLFFKTESTGDIDFTRGAAHASQPKLARVVCISADSETKAITHVVDVAARESNEESVLSAFYDELQKSDVRVGYMIGMDNALLKIAESRLTKQGLFDSDFLDTDKNICVSEEFGKYQKLEKVYRANVGSDYDGRDLFDEVTAIMQIYFSAKEAKESVRH